MKKMDFAQDRYHIFSVATVILALPTLIQLLAKENILVLYKNLPKRKWPSAKHRRKGDLVRTYLNKN